MNENENKLLGIFEKILENQNKQNELLEEMKNEIIENKKSTKEIENTSNWFFFFYIILPIIIFVGSIFLGLSILSIFTK